MCESYLQTRKNKHNIHNNNYQQYCSMHTRGGARLKRTVGPGEAKQNSGGANLTNKINIQKYITSSL